MEWQRLIADLVDAGMTQEQIGAACAASQSTISELARGKSTSPSFALGSAILKLHGERTQPAQKKPARARKVAA